MFQNVFLLSLFFSFFSPLSFACEPFSLEETECWSVVGNTNISVPENVDQQTMFDQISLIISDVRMIPASCRRPLVSFLCRSTFISCSPPSLPCGDCLLSLENCGELFSSDCSLFCASSSRDSSLSSSPSSSSSSSRDSSLSSRSSLSSPIPVFSCLNETAPEIECCPDPFFLSEECEFPICPFYGYSEDGQEGVTLAFFIISWISVLVAFVGLIPSFYYQKWQITNSLAQVLLLCCCIYLLMANWATYVDTFNYQCQFESRSDFFLSGYCLSQCFLMSFWLLFTFMMFFWYALRVFFNTYQHSSLWERYNLPIEIPSRTIIFPVSFIISFSFPLALNIVLRDEEDVTLITLNATCQCVPSIWDLGLWLFWLPSLIIATFATALVLATICRLLFITVVVPIRFVLVLFLFAFVFETAVIHVIYFNRYRDNIHGNAKDWAECVASHPQQAGFIDEICSYEPVPGFPMLAYVQLTAALVPLLYTAILHFSRKQYWEELKGVFVSKKGLSREQSAELHLPNVVKNSQSNSLN